MGLPRPGLDGFGSTSGRSFLLVGKWGKDLQSRFLEERYSFKEHLDICIMCGVEEETGNHVFIHCRVVSAVRSHFIRRCGLDWCNPGTLPKLVEAWRNAPFFGCGLLIWRIIPFAVLRHQRSLSSWLILGFLSG